MSILPSLAKWKRANTSSLVAVVVVCLIVACGTGLAAFAGLLPASKSVAAVVTATPLIDIQVDASATTRRGHAKG